jgi:hypothetical protein
LHLHPSVEVYDVLVLSVVDVSTTSFWQQVLLEAVLFRRREHDTKENLEDQKIIVSTTIVPCLPPFAPFATDKAPSPLHPHLFDCTTDMRGLLLCNDSPPVNQF